MSGDLLKSQLEDIIDGHTSLSYTPGVWEAHKDLYEDPENPDRIILFYSQASWEKSAQDPGSGYAQYWNREHLWPRSYGVGTSGPDNTDLFHLVPANKAVNDTRGNLYFDESDPTDPNFADPAYSIAPDCTMDSDSWEPADGQKGWVARAMFYMTTRYSYLSLVNTPPDPAPNTSSSRMAQLSTLLDWNRRFPPAAKELEVNQRVYENYQFNRNPYIDFPEFADAVWVEGPSWGAWRLAHFSLEELLDVTVSGDAADPDSDGLNNLMEMARYSDPREPDPSPLEMLSNSPGQITIRYLRASDTSQLNLVMVLESSPNMLDWSPVPQDGAVSAPAGTGQQSVTIEAAIPAAESRFYRLSVARP